MTEPLRKSTSTPTSSREGKSTGDDAAGARTAEASTKTAMSLKLPLMVIASCNLVGNSVSYCTSLFFTSLLTPWHFELDAIIGATRIGSTRIGAVGCAVAFWLFGAKLFDLSVGLYLRGLRVSGLLDHRSARLLAATQPHGKYCSSLTGRRYRVMGEENAQIYAEDKTAYGDRVACWWWAHGVLSALIGTYFSVVDFVLQDSYDSLQWQNGTDV